MIFGDSASPSLNVLLSPQLATLIVGAIGAAVTIFALVFQTRHEDRRAALRQEELQLRVQLASLELQNSHEATRAAVEKGTQAAERAYHEANSVNLKIAAQSDALLRVKDSIPRKGKPR